MADAKSVELPAELRMLTSFLHSDGRPSIVYEAQQHDGHIHAEPREVYTNPALRTLIEETNGLSATISEAVGRAKRLGASVTWTDGMRWSLRPLEHPWTVAVCEGAQDIRRLPGSEPVKIQRINVDSAEQLRDQDVSHDETVDNPSRIDWTRFTVPGLSSWVQSICEFDWDSTAVGPMHTWTTELRQNVVGIMASPDPRLLVWGADQTLIYNEACVPVLGAKHPGCLGQPAYIWWADIWGHVGPLVDAAYRGKATRMERMPLFLQRNGYVEETSWDFTMLPVVGKDGCSVGVLDELSESTMVVTGKRRRRSVAEVGEQIANASSLEELWQRFLKGLEPAKEDVPYALLYTVVDDLSDGELDSRAASSLPTVKKCVLQSNLGLQTEQLGDQLSFGLLDNLENTAELIKPCLQAWKTREPVILCKRDKSIPSCLMLDIPGRGFGDTITTAIALPITSLAGNEVLAILIIGLSPRSPFNEEYTLYTRIIADVLFKAAALISLPQEQRRAKKIAEDINSSLAQQLRLTTLQAERSEAKFSRLVATAPTGMFLLDGEGRILHINDAYVEVMGDTRENLIARSQDTSAWHDPLHSDESIDFFEAWDRLINHKTPINFQYRIKRPWKSIDKATGSELNGDTWLLVTAFPEVEPDGRVSTVVGWLTDISYQKFSENLLAQRLEDALENKRQTENFIDMTSHEMRNPLSAILQSADYIVSALQSAEQPIVNEELKLTSHDADELVDSAQTIILCAQHQKRIVDDILTLSKLDASLLVISPDKIRPPTLVERALKMYEAEIQRAKITAKSCIELTYEQLKVDWVVLDPSRLLQVIINLLTNAIKFTQYSETRNVTICVGASYEKPTGKHHNVCFIPTRHARPTHTLSSDWGDGEEIYLQFAVSDTGRGLTPEEMKLMFQRFQQASPKTYKQYGGSGLGLFISRELCELQGGQIGVNSEDGKTTFTFYVKAKRWSENGNPHSQQRRQSVPRLQSASAVSTSSNHRRSLPLSEAASQLQDTWANGGPRKEDDHKESKRLKHAAAFTEQKQAPLHVLTNGEQAQLHVLVVEDNLINQKVMSQQLRRAGCIVHVVNHGLECLAFLERSAFCCSTATPLSVILLDLEMPTMDGLTCIRHIRERQESGAITGHVPVIAITANARSEQISVAIDAGMDHVVTKPFRIPELVPQMRSLVAKLSSRN